MRRNSQRLFEHISVLRIVNSLVYSNHSNNDWQRKFKQIAGALVAHWVSIKNIKVLLEVLLFEFQHKSFIVITSLYYVFYYLGYKTVIHIICLQSVNGAPKYWIWHGINKLMSEGGGESFEAKLFVTIFLVGLS